MRKLYFLVILFSFLQLKAVAQNGWKLVHTFSQEISSVFFKDSLNGFAFPAPSGIYKTTDGGTSWNIFKIANLNSDIVKIIKTSNNFLIGIGSGGTIIKSSDFGSNWEIKIVDTLDNLTSICSTIDGKLFASSTGKNLYKSTDDGDSWSIYSLDTMSFELTGISFSNSNVGFGVGYYETSIKTTDGGDTWFTIPPIISGRSMFAIKFISEDIGYVVGGSEVDKTTDGGGTWERKYEASGSQLNDITTYGNNFAWVVGQDKIVYTTNAGEAWSPQSYTPFIYVNNVVCVDSLICFVVGGRNLYKTINGGSLTGIENLKTQASNYELLQNYPNPFNPTTSISYQIPKSEFVSLIVI